MRFSLFALALLAAPLAAQTTHVVTVRSFEFDPATITIEAGDTVRWVNENGTHNVRQLTGPESFSRSVESAPWEFEFTFREVGANTYHCDPHSGIMQGTVTVAPNTSTEGPDEELRPGLEYAGANPFRETAKLSLQMSAPGEVRVSVYDARGRELAVLMDGTAVAGVTPIEWTPGTGASAVYVVRVTGAVHASLGIARIGTDPHGGH